VPPRCPYDIDRPVQRSLGRPGSAETRAARCVRRRAARRQPVPAAGLVWLAGACAVYSGWTCRRSGRAARPRPAQVNSSPQARLPPVPITGQPPCHPGAGEHPLQPDGRDRGHARSSDCRLFSVQPPQTTCQSSRPRGDLRPPPHRALVQLGVTESASTGGPGCRRRRTPKKKDASVGTAGYRPPRTRGRSRPNAHRAGE